jgi:hypothetical protein
MIQKFFMYDDSFSVIALDLPKGLTPRQMLVLANDYYEEKYGLDGCPLIDKKFNQVGDVHVMNAKTRDGDSVQVVWSNDPYAAESYIHGGGSNVYHLYPAVVLSTSNS